jgi:hypothetical protein
MLLIVPCRKRSGVTEVWSQISIPRIVVHVPVADQETAVLLVIAAGVEAENVLNVGLLPIELVDPLPAVYPGQLPLVASVPFDPDVLPGAVPIAVISRRWNGLTAAGGVVRLWAYQ